MQEKRVIPTDLLAARDLAEELLGKVQSQGYEEAELFAIRLALEEGLINAIKHGNKFDRDKSITVCMELDARRVVISIADEGQGFDPATVPDPTADENLEKPCGRGIMLMRAYMDRVEFNDRGNEVHMVKNRS